MKSRYVMCCALAIAMNSSFAIAQDQESGDTLVLSLEQCRRMALDGNAVAKTAKNDVRIAKETSEEAFTKYFPVISAMGTSVWANHNMIQYDVLDLFQLGIIKNGLMAGVTAVQPIFAGGQIVNGNALAKLGEKVAELRKRQTEEEVYVNVDRYYWKLVSLNSQKETLASLIETLDTLTSQTQAAVDAGVILKNELLKIELQRNDFKSTMIDLENGIALCSNLLGQYIGVGLKHVDVSERVIPGKLPDFSYGNWQNPVESVSNTVDYSLLNSAIKAAELEKKMTIGSNLPTVGLGAGWYYHNLFKQDHNFGAVFLAINVPLSGWWGGSHAIKRKNLEIRNARIRFEDGNELLMISMRNAWDSLTSAYRKIENAAESMIQADENLRLNRSYYEVGVSTITDLLTAQTLYKKACDQYISAYSDYCVRDTEYLKATGQLSTGKITKGEK